MDDPHLIAGAAGGDVEALLEKLLIAHGERAALRGVNKRNKNDIAFVALELRGVAAEQAVKFVTIGRDVRAQQIVDFESLFVADKRNNAEAERLARAIVLILGLLHRGSNKGGGRERFLAIDFAVAGGARNAIGNGVRQQMDAAGVAQRLDAPIVGNHVAELNDFGNAPEMLDETSGAAEGLPCEVVNGNLAVVEIGVGNARQVLENEILNDAEILTDCRRADLFVVTDDEDSLAKIKSGERHDVALAGFVNDDNVEARVAGIEIFHHARERHDPDRNGAATLGHFSGRLRAQQANANPVALADSSDGVEPSDKGLALVGRSAASLAGPRAAVDQIHSHAAEVLTKLFDFGLQRFQRCLGATIELVIELAPNPGGGRIARRFSFTVEAVAIANGSGPCGRGAFQFAKQRAAEIEVGLAALQFEKLVVSVAISPALLFMDRLLQMDENFGCAGVARGELVAAFQLAELLFQLLQTKLLVARIENRKQRFRDCFA